MKQMYQIIHRIQVIAISGSNNKTIQCDRDNPMKL